MFAWGLITGVVVTLIFGEVGKAALTWVKQKLFK
jgi:hypothetical protein